MLEVLTIDKYEKFLRQKSQEVSFSDSELNKNLEDIKEWCLRNEGLYAMAAIQFGIPKRIVYIKSTKPNDTSADEQDKQVMMLNPEIISKQGKTEFWEACVSGLDNFALVERPYKIVVNYQDKNAQTHIQEFEGFAATVVSHELDHLDGIFHMDRAKEMMHMPASERVEFRKTHPYNIISKTCEFNYPKTNQEK